MKIKNQRGFAALEAILLVAILAIIAGTGWYVWQSKRAIDKTNNQAAVDSQSVASTNSKSKSVACATPDKSIKGTLHTSSTNIYSICIPDGWQLLDIESAGDSLIADAVDLHYKPGSPAVIEKTSAGKDGPFAFSMFVTAGKTDTSPVAGTGYVHYMTDGSLKAVNTTGTKYSRFWTSQDVAKLGQGAGGYAAGTKLYAYTFLSRQKKLGVEIDYMVAPGDTDQSSQIEKVVSTLRFN